MTISEDMVERSDEWLIVKRDLYFMPDCRGYTGIRDQAGRYTHEFAKGYESEGTTIVHLSEAPEFREAAYSDLVIKHLIQQRGEREKMLAFMKELSDALISIRPLGGSELFVKRFGQYFADPTYCKDMIKLDAARRHETMTECMRLRRQADTLSRHELCAPTSVVPK